MNQVIWKRPLPLRLILTFNALLLLPALVACILGLQQVEIPILLLTILASIWVAINLTQDIVDPIRNLSDAVNEMGREANGHPQTPAPAGVIELAMLTDTFNGVVAKLKTEGRERTQAERTAQEAYRRAERLAQLSTALSQATDEPSILSAIRMAAESPDSAAATLFYINTDKSGYPTEIVAVAHEDYSQFIREDQIGLRLNVQEHPITTHWIENPDTILFISDIETDSRLDPTARDLLLRRNARSIILIPLQKASRWQGVVIVCWPTQHEFSADEQYLYVSLRQTVAAVVAERRAIIREQEAHRAVARRAIGLEIVAGISADIASILDMSRLLQTVCDAASVAFNLHFGIYLLDGTDDLKLAASQGPYYADVGTGNSKPLASDLNNRLPIQAIKENKIIRVNDLQGPIWQHGHEIVVMRSEVAIPLMVGDHTMGILDIQHNEPGRFDDLDVQVLNLLAQQVAVAIENARLYEEKVQDAKKMRHLSEVKTAFLSNMSHELRTPLNALMGYIDLMLLKLEPPQPLILDGLDGGVTLESDEPEGIDPQVLKNNLLRMKDSAMRLSNQINDLLDIGKIEAGRLDVYSEPCSLREMVEAIEGQAIALNKNRLHFSAFIDDNLPDVILSDREKIERIILNLLSNAFKFTQQGEVELMLDNDLKGHVLISIRDTGPGIAPYQKNIIFEEFRQAESGTTKQYGGTGLGLTITQNLVKTMGGSIRVESEPGKGSTFIVTLPLLPVGERAK